MQTISSLDRAIAIRQLLDLRNAAQRCECGQECYCAKNFEYAEMKLEELGVDVTRNSIAYWEQHDSHVMRYHMSKLGRLVIRREVLWEGNGIT